MSDVYLILREKMESIFQGKLSNEIDFNKVAEDIIQKIPLYYDKNKIWYRWDKNKWNIIDEIDILNSIDQELKIANLSHPKYKIWLLNAIQMKARKNKPRELKKTEIQFQDEIIDIFDGTTTKANPTVFCFNPIPWKLSHVTETPQIDKIMAEWVGTENVKKLQEWIAYNMYSGGYPINRIVVLHGDGRNGKTTLISLMKKILGKDNAKSGDFETVFIMRFGMAALYRKLSLILGECEFRKLEQTGRFKDATGGDAINIEFKNKTGFDYENYAKITMSTNSLPETDDKTSGFYRRQLIIDFKNQFTEKYDVLSRIPEQEYCNFCSKAIILLKDLLLRGTFTNEGTIEERQKKYEDLSDPLKTFLELNTVDMTEGYILRSQLRNKFYNYLQTNKLRQWTPKHLGTRMAEKYDTNYKDGERAWIGLKWKDDIELMEIEKQKIYMKCTICGADESNYFDTKTGAPICEKCKQVKL